MQKNNNFLGTEPIGKLLFRLSVPTVCAQLINMLYNIVDRIYIGHMPGDGSLALTGVGICMPIIMFVSAFAALIGAGGAPRASIFMGRGDHPSAKKTLGQCFTLQTIVSLIITALLLLFARPMLMAFGASENTLPYAADYLSIYLFGTCFVQLTLGLNPYISAQGRAMTAMSSIIIGAALNIVLDPIFIFALNMGVRGAALATVLSQAASCTWILCALASEKASIRLERRFVRFDKAILLGTVALGISPFTMVFTESAVQVVLNRGMMTYGGDMYVGTITIIASVVQLFSTPLHGYTNGVQPLLSFNYAAGKLDRVRKTFKYLLFSTLAITMSYCTLIELFPRVFIRLFAQDEALIELTVKGLRIYSLGLGIFGLQNAIQSMFVGLGQAKVSLFIAILRKIILLIPLALVLPTFLGVNGVYIAEPIADITSASIATGLMLYHFNKILARREQMLLSQHKGA